MSVQNSGGPNYYTAFNNLSRTAVQLPSPRAQVVRSQPMEAFIEVCGAALDLAFDDPGSAELMPGVDIEEPLAVVKAYLLFLANVGLMPTSETSADVYDDWHETVTEPVWKLLGFERKPPTMALGMAFMLLAQREHQAPELRALIWAVGELAAARLLPGVRI